MRILRNAAILVITVGAVVAAVTGFGTPFNPCACSQLHELPDSELRQL